MLVSNRFNNKIDDDYKTFTRRFDALKRQFRGVCTCTPHNLPLNTMLYRGFKLSSSWQLFSKEIDRLRVIFRKL